MKRLLKYLSQHPAIAAGMPKPVRNLARKIFPMADYNHLVWAKNNEFVGTDKEWQFKGTSKYTIGIVFDPAHYHRYYQYACVDLGFSYKVLDLRTDDWVNKVAQSGCDAFVIWPSLETFILKEMNEERLHFIKNYMNKPVYPSPEEVWMLNNKRRIRDWLQINQFAYPGTWCFYTEEEAMKFIEKAPVFQFLQINRQFQVFYCFKTIADELKFLIQLVKMFVLLLVISFNNHLFYRFWYQIPDKIDDSSFYWFSLGKCITVIRDHGSNLRIGQANHFLLKPVSHT